MFILKMKKRILFCLIFFVVLILINSCKSYRPTGFEDYSEPYTTKNYDLELPDYEYIYTFSNGNDLFVDKKGNIFIFNEKNDRTYLGCIKGKYDNIYSANDMYKIMKENILIDREEDIVYFRNTNSENGYKDGDIIKIDKEYNLSISEDNLIFNK